MDQDEWERTRKALETELIEKAFDLSDHMGRLHGFTLEIAHTSPALYLCLGEAEEIQRSLPELSQALDPLS